MEAIKKLIYFFYSKRLWYLFSGSRVTVEKGGILKIGENVSIKKTNIYVKSGSSLTIGNNTKLFGSSISMIVGGKSSTYIGENCSLSEFNLSVVDGNIHIGNNNFIEKGDKAEKPSFEIQGALRIEDYNRLKCSIWSRFNSKVQIGSRNAINEGTEIRSDEKITIGDYNQISYDCVVWDTNTHNIYKAEKRRKITNSQYPDFGLEFEKPKTAPVFIGSDCWVGRNAGILKGTRVENKCIIAYGTLLTNVSIPENKTLFNKHELKIIDNQL